MRVPLFLLPLPPVGLALAARKFFRRIHTSAALFRTAGAGRVAITFIQKIVVGQLFSGGNVARADDPHAAVNVLFGFAIRIAGMVDKGRESVAVDDIFFLADRKEIGDIAVLINAIAFFLADDGSGITDDLIAPLDGGSGENAGGVNVRGSDNQSHGARMSS